MSRRARTYLLAREAKHALAFAGPEDESDDEGGIDATNGSGPAGTYGCACVARAARTCVLQRYGYLGHFTRYAETCECLCHQWSDDE